MLNAGQRGALNLVEDQQRDQVEGELEEPLVNGGGVEDNEEILLGGLFHDVLQAVDLVLQNQIVAGAELLQGAVNLGVSNILIAAPIEQDAVLPARLHLDDGVAIGART